MKRLPENLKLIRKQRWKMSQDKFAELIDSSRSKINSYENGGVEPSIDFMIQLEILTGINIKDLFSGELQLAKIPILPLSEEQGEVETFEEELPDYDQTFVDLKSYHTQITKRFQRLEKRIQSLERP